MSFEAAQYALATSTGSPVTKLVLLALADRHNRDDGFARPSIRRLAVDTELSERSVQRAIRVLIEAGHLSIEERAGRPSLYRFPAIDPPVRGVTESHPSRNRGVTDSHPGASHSRGRGVSLAPEPKGTIIEPIPLTPNARALGGPVENLKGRTPRDRGTNPRAVRKRERATAGAANLGRLYAHQPITVDEFTESARRQYPTRPDLVEVAVESFTATRQEAGA